MVQGFVTKFEEQCSMNWLNESEQLFKNCQFVWEALDATFQQPNRLTVSVQEGKQNYSSQHELYGYKFEIYVRPCSLPYACSSHILGSVSDLTALHKRYINHERQLKKRDEDQHFEEEYATADEYPQYWEVPGDRGYQNASEILHAVTPQEKLTRGVFVTFNFQFTVIYPSFSASYLFIYLVNIPFCVFRLLKFFFICYQTIKRTRLRTRGITTN